MTGEQSAVLVENRQLGEEDTERVLNGASILDLHDLYNIGQADFLVRTTKSMFDDCFGW